MTEGALDLAALRVLGLVPSARLLEELNADEHPRWEAFSRALVDELELSVWDEQMAPAEQAVLDVVLAEPDHAMREATVVRYLELRSSAAPTVAGFDRWRTRLVTRLPADLKLARQRLSEWRLCLLAAEDPGAATDEILSSSDWVQRNLAAESSSTLLLGQLASAGRTRRVRAEASRRLKAL